MLLRLTGCARRQREAHLLHQRIDLLESLSFLVLAFPTCVETLGCMTVLGDRILLHTEVHGSPKMLPTLESQVVCRQLGEAS